MSPSGIRGQTGVGERRGPGLQDFGGLDLEELIRLDGRNVLPSGARGHELAGDLAPVERRLLKAVGD